MINLRRKRKKSFEVEEVDITSLLDILVILLVFLLRSFNDSELSIDIVNELALPYSLSTSPTHNSLVIQLNKNREIFINQESIGFLNTEGIETTFSTNIQKKYDILTKEKKSSSKIVNLLFDKEISYQDVNKLLRFVDNSGFNQYKFIIQSKE